MSTESVRLAEITPANFEAACAIRLRPGQEGLVRPVQRSLAEAYVYRDVAWPRVILVGDRVVGFVMAYLDAVFVPGQTPRSGIWRLNIAADHQRQGYGRFAVEACCAEIRRRGGPEALVSWVPGEHGPAGFYRRLGFHPTGRMIGDQVQGARTLT